MLFSRTRRKIKKIRAALNGGGEHWVQGAYEYGGRMCLIGGARHVFAGNAYSVDMQKDEDGGYHKALVAIGRAIIEEDGIGAVRVKRLFDRYAAPPHNGLPPTYSLERELITWNDMTGRQWAEVESVLTRAVKFA